LKLAYGYAFRLPTIAEQFGQDGNPQLDPETSRSFIATVSWHGLNRSWSAELTGFRQRVESLIQWRQVPGTFIWKPANVEQFKSDGLDLTLGLSPAESVRLVLGGTFQNARESSEEGRRFQDAMFVPNLKWRAEISGRWNIVRYRADLTYTSDRIKRFGDIEKRISRAWELGGAVRVTVSDNIEFSLSAFDLTDRKRADQFGFSLADSDYPSPGRRFMVGTRVSF
jgi:outer membrane cobalamin receptor